MERFFSAEGPFISFLDKLGRIIILNVLWILCCIPIVTIGASSSAFYYSMVKTVRRERSSGSREFFRCFKRVFKKTALTSIGFVLLTAILIIDILFWRNKETGMAFINMNVCTVCLLLLIPFCAFYFAIVSRFIKNFKDTLKFTYSVMFRDLPYSLAILLIVLLTAFVLYVYFISIFFITGISCYVISIIIENVFKKYIPKPEDGEELWYDE